MPPFRELERPRVEEPHRIRISVKFDGEPIVPMFGDERIFTFLSRADEREVTVALVEMLEQIQDALLEKVNDCLERPDYTMYLRPWASLEEGE